MAFITDQATALPDGYRHIVLSPHLDDAALSCGGFIARMTAAGERVLVVNVCSGIPSAQRGSVHLPNRSTNAGHCRHHLS